jgi:hypothetical protein
MNDNDGVCLLLNADVFGLLLFVVVVVVVDLVPIALHEPKATSQRCRSGCDLAFKQKKCSPGIIKSNRSGSFG